MTIWTEQDSLEFKLHELAMKINENKDDANLIHMVNNYKELLGHYKLFLHKKYVLPREEFLMNIYKEVNEK